MSDTLILGFDTSAAHCAAALLCNGQIIASAGEDMARGQAERLIPLLEDVLITGGVTWANLDRIGVGVGPGNFTGIRISVSAARGLALALGIPAVGVNAFDAISHGVETPHVPVVGAPRDQVYMRAPQQEPVLTDVATAKVLGLPLHFPPAPADLAMQIARVAAHADPTLLGAPAPLYLKPADAAPARDQAPAILDDKA